MASGDKPLRANPELLSFSANLRQHLTELTMWMDNSKGIPRRLGALGKLTKLQSLVVTCDEEDIESGLFHDLSGQRLVFKLPELTSLHLEGLWHGEVVLSCPRLAKARFQNLHTMCIELEDAVLTSLSLSTSQSIELAIGLPKKLLQHLTYLSIECWNVLGRHIMDDVAHMTRLEYLYYWDFLASDMPKRFPGSLYYINLRPFEWPMAWCVNLPETLRKLPRLRHLFVCNQRIL